MAELYDRSRPSYPPALVDDVLEFAGAVPGSADRALEVGAGTGKATTLFAERGVSVVALEPGGALAAFWTRPDWPACALRDTLGEVYARNGCGGDSSDPMNPSTIFGDEDWAAEIGRAGGFTAAETRRYRWESDYTTEGYLDLLGTHSVCLVLGAAQREALLGDIADVIDAHGGAFRMNLVTRLCLARAV